MVPAFNPKSHQARVWQTSIHGTWGCLAVVGLCLIFGAKIAQATPTAVTLKVRGVPIHVDPTVANSPTYPGTDNTLGGATAAEGEIRISGTEYGGFPPPLTGLTFHAPAGVKLHPQGFPTCSPAILESHEVAHCPKRSAVTSVGSVTGVVSFGGTRVHESLTLQAFFASGGEFAFYAEGRTPTVIEVLGKANVTYPGGEFGPELTASVPLVETVPGAPYGVVETAKLTIGAAFMQKGKLVSYITLPKTCPKGGFPESAELRFLIGEPVTVNTKMPCPSK